MKKTLLCLAIGILSFYISVFANTVFQLQSKVLPPAAFEPERVFGTNDEYNGCVFGSSKTATFSIIEGDYDSQQNKDLWMYLYSTVENEKPIVSGDVRTSSKIYDIKKGSYFNPNTGELNFTTKKIGKTLYKFSGKIIQKNYKDGESVLKGKLERVKNNSVIEVTNHEFKFYYHVCSQ